MSTKTVLQSISVDTLKRTKRDYYFWWLPVQEFCNFAAIIIGESDREVVLSRVLLLHRLGSGMKAFPVLSKQRTHSMITREIHSSRTFCNQILGTRISLYTRFLWLFSLPPPRNFICWFFSIICQFSKCK